MSIHTSFGKASSLKAHRSVLKRYEKIKTLDEKGQWDESKGSLGLQKVKVFKLKAKKEKAKAAEGAEAAEGAQGQAAGKAPEAPKAKA